MSVLERNGPLWQPTPDQISRARITEFIEGLRTRDAIGDEVRNTHDLQQWSVKYPELFWSELWRAANIIANGSVTHNTAFDRVLINGGNMRPPCMNDGPQWFEGARLNFAENLLRRRDSVVAIVSWSERGRESSITFAELALQVAQCASAMRAMGIVTGDRVAGYIPNIANAVIAMLAATSLGAIWSSCSPDFGTKGVLDRFGQIEPRLLIVADGYRYAGKRIDCLQRVQQVADAIPSIEAVWIVPWLDQSPDISQVRDARLWNDALSLFAQNTEPSFTRLPFDHPLYILYSSGTTGLPKCMVHGAGGTLLQHWKEHALHTDIGDGDVLFYFTTCGWMMWNWLVSALSTGATIVLYDGAPLSPDVSILWRMVQQERVTVFGTSAKYLATVQKEGQSPRENFDLSSLKAILSTGSPLAAHSYDFVYSHIHPTVRLASISGGTDIVSCFALGDPIGTVWRGELQVRGLGMAVDVFDEDGKSQRGLPGELVCTQPFPSMPVRFWNDPDGSKYFAAYFDHFENVWRHGDWAEITEHDGLIIHGRSDATLNPGGVRIGTAEIYRQVEQVADILESIVIEQTIGDGVTSDSRVVLFVRMQPGAALTDAIRGTIRARIREHASPHHVPKLIIQVADIPRTISGKITELAVRDVVHGREVKNSDALANPEALALFRNLPELSDT